MKLCGRLSRAVVRLDGIVGDVLDFARDTRVRPQVNSFDGPVAAALANVADLVEQYGITVELAVEETVEAAFDPSLVEQAILNLVRNACEAMGEAAQSRVLRPEPVAQRDGGAGEEREALPPDLGSDASGEVEELAALAGVDPIQQRRAAIEELERMTSAGS